MTSNKTPLPATVIICPRCKVEDEENYGSGLTLIKCKSCKVTSHWNRWIDKVPFSSYAGSHDT